MSSVHIPGYDNIVEVSAKTRRRLLARARRVSDSSQCFVKIIMGDPEGKTVHDDFQMLQKFKGREGVVQVVETVKTSLGYGIVSKFIEGVPLSQCGMFASGINREALQQFCAIAIQTCEALAWLHRADILHGDLSDQNILYNQENNLVTITGFGSAPRSVSIDATSGTCKNMSPEQTGKTSLTVDCRSDLYSLGSVLYELVAGRSMFLATDALGMMHRHLTAEPAPLQRDMPDMLSQVVMKLIKKHPSHRYQSAWGAMYDFKLCLAQLDIMDVLTEIPPFGLATKDISNTLHRSSKLYGREDVLAQLLSLLDSAKEGTTQVAVLSGPSGCGKSTLAKELHREVQRQHVIWLGSKLDQYTCVPHACFLPLMDQLVDRMLTLDTEAFAKLRKEINEVLGGYGQLLVNAFPSVHLLIGDQKPAPELTPSEERNKFLQACADFFTVCCVPGRPSVLFMDDMQWADAASLTLFHTVCTTKKLSLLVVCAIRSEEVDETHPFALCLNKIDQSYPIHRLSVNNLTLSQTSTLIADTLQGHCNSAMVKELAISIFDRTSGNPFFVTQLFDALYEHKALHLEMGGEYGEWVWYPHVVVTESVIELLISKISLMSKRAQHLLKMAAIIGSEFDVSLLRQVTENTIEELLVDLFDLVSAGILTAEENKPPVSNSRLLVMHTAEVLLSKTYSFLHDRVQQAASSLFENEEEKQRAHYMIAMKMWQNKKHTKDIPINNNNQNIFAIANHMLEGIQNVRTTQIGQVCELFLEAGKHAREGMSSFYARKYLNAILVMVPSSAENWDTHYSLLRACHLELSESSFQVGELAEAQILLSHLLEYAESNVDKAEILDKMAAIAHANGDTVGAAKRCFDILAMFGVHFSQDNKEQALEKEYKEFCNNLEERKIDNLEDLLDLPLIKGSENVCISRAFKAIIAPLFQSDPPMLRLVAATAVNFSVKHGISNFMCYPYGMFAMVLHWFFNDTSRAQSLAMASIGISDKIGGVADHYRACLAVGACVFIWTKSIHDADHLLETGTHLAILHGDFLFSSFLYFVRSFQIYSRPTLKEDYYHYQQLLDGNQKHGAGIMQAKYIIQAMMSGNLCLQGKTRHSFSFEAEDVIPDMQIFIATLEKESYFLALLAFFIYRAFVLFILWDMQGAYESLEKVRAFVPYMPGLALNAPFRFIEALTRLQRIAPSFTNTCSQRPTQPGPCSEEAARAYLLTVDQNLCALQGWAKTMPKTFRHMLLIVYAEKRRVLHACPYLEKFDPHLFSDSKIEKLDKYEIYRAAIASAKESGITGHVGLCHELTMRFWQSQDEIDYARIHWRAAMLSYRSWGAKNKTSQLQEEFNYSSLDPNLGVNPSHEEFGALVLDEKRRLFAASRLISSEIVLDRLLVKLMEVIVEHVGATFGLLLSSDDKEAWRVECEHGANVKRSGLPTTILNFVYKKHQVVVLSDAATNELFCNDSYIRQYKPKSVLCVPIVLHGIFINAIYLENNGFEGSFTSSLGEVAEMLASQAATAIQNGRLYRKLNEYTQTLEHEVGQRTIELSSARVHADQANKAKSTFLACMSHEIRTPMNGIMVSVELMKLSVLTPEQTELADIVITCSDALLILINDILDLSKIEADKIDLENAWFDLQTCLESVLDILAPKAFPKGLDFEFQMWGSPGETLEVKRKGIKKTYKANVPRVVKGDYTRVRQIIINLCNNAVKFTSKGEVTIRVWWREIESDAHLSDPSSERPVELYFSVQDTGIGVPSHRLPALFKAFSQVESSTTREYGGTGLGLAICEPLVQLMGGEIWVESVENQGSNFQFTLASTIMRGEAEEGEESSRHLDKCVNLTPDVCVTPQLKLKLSVLLVQNASMCADMFKGALEQLGCHVTRACLCDGMIALQTQQQFDVCLVDWCPENKQEPGVISGEEELHVVTRAKHGEMFIQAFRAWETVQYKRGGSGGGEAAIVDELIQTITTTALPSAPSLTATQRSLSSSKRLPMILVSYDRQHKTQGFIEGFLSKPIKQRQLSKLLEACCLHLFPYASTPALKPHSRQLTQSVVADNFSELRIILAEDNKINVRMAMKMADSLGFTATVVGNGKLAVDLVKTWHDEGNPCQVILMDVQMPIMDGIEATIQIRNLPLPHAHQPYIIALTANAMVSDKQACLQAGMNFFLSKPLNRQDLARALRDAAEAKGYHYTKR